MARLAEERARRDVRDISKWSSKRFLKVLVRKAEAYDTLGGLPYWANNGEDPSAPPEYRDAIHQALAACGRCGLDPQNFAEFFAEEVLSFCVHKGFKARSGLFHSDKTLEWYDRWAVKQRRRAGRADAGLVAVRDPLQKVEAAYVSVLGTSILCGIPIKRSLKYARSAAREVAGATYNRSTNRRTMALCEFLHKLHPDLPDVLVPRRGWRCSEILKAATRLVSEKDGCA